MIADGPRASSRDLSALLARLVILLVVAGAMVPAAHWRVLHYRANTGHLAAGLFVVFCLPLLLFARDYLFNRITVLVWSLRLLADKVVELGGGGGGKAGEQGDGEDVGVFHGAVLVTGSGFLGEESRRQAAVDHTNK